MENGGLVAKSCPTLETPWTGACQAPLSVGFSRQEHCSGLPCPPPGDLPDPGIKLSPTLAGRFLPLVPPEKPTVVYSILVISWIPSRRNCLNNPVGPTV